MPSYTLPRSERLRSLKAIRRVFGEGHSGFIYPFRYVWIADTMPSAPSEQERGIEAMFSVPKKFHKRANKRNLLKRRTREAYRLNRNTLLGELRQRGVVVNMAFIYSTKECHTYKTIEHAMQRILAHVCESI